LVDYLLFVGKNKICDNGIKAIAEAIKTNTTLKEFKVSDNNVTDEGGAAMVIALKDNRTLNKLNFSSLLHYS
jgi:Ran GTPase-activating protein (RanGAP) involved in mRNA processing and transport